MRRRIAVALACLALLAAGLALRLPGLGDLLTPDEGDWGRNTAQFTTALLQHNWAGTLTVPYPGVTTTWAGTLGLLARAWFAPAGGGVAALAQALAHQPNRMDIIPWLRLPVILAGALAALALSVLVRPLLGDAAAALAAALLAFDPFVLAHSRLIQTDALLTIFLAGAWLAVLAAGQTRRRRWLVVGGLAFGAAVLTKSPALVIGPPAVAWLAWQAWRSAASRRWVASGRALLLFGLPALAAIWLCWPALWVAPAAVAGRVFGLMAAFSQTGHELGNFWLGQPVDRPGALFYPAVILWRTTAITLPGLLLALVFGLRLWVARGRAVWSSDLLLPSARQTRTEGSRSEAVIVAGLWFYVAWFTLMMSLGDKAFDRYLLPVFPIVDILAAWGWLALVRALIRLAPRLAARRDLGAPARRAAPASARAAVALVWAATLLVAGQALSAVAARPAYLSAYNPLAGGIATARRVMLVGWGEGLPEAAAFLNRQSAAAVGHVASWYGQNVFGAFYHGQSYDLYYDAQTAGALYARDTDYVVTYINQEQRALVDPGVAERLTGPLFTSRAGPVALAEVYRWPKPFAHTADRLVAPGLRLLGWDENWTAAGRSLRLTLYWDAGAVAQPGAAGNPRVRAWLKDAAGAVWSTAEAAALPAGQSATAAWLDRTGLPQTLVLDLPTGAPAGAYRLEAAPLTGQGVALGDINVPPTRLAAATSMPAADWQPINTQVVFDDKVRLAGYQTARDGDTLHLDLLWAPLSASLSPSQYFVHLVGAGDQIIAQADGPLALAAAGPIWQPGDLVRQRVTVTVPAAIPTASFRIYVGLYRPAGGARLPLAVAGQPVADGRYLLPGAR